MDTNGHIKKAPRAAPGRARVRRWLKAGLRSYGLRCRLVRYPSPYGFTTDVIYDPDDPESVPPAYRIPDPRTPGPPPMG